LVLGVDTGHNELLTWWWLGSRLVLGVNTGHNVLLVTT